MTELNVLVTDVGPLDAVEFAPDARIEYNGGELRAVYPADAPTETYAIAEYGFDAAPLATVDVPDDSVILSVGSGTLSVAVPIDEYGGN